MTDLSKAHWWAMGSTFGLEVAAAVAFVMGKDGLGAGLFIAAMCAAWVLLFVAAGSIGTRLGDAIGRGARNGVERGVQSAFRSHADALLQQAAAADSDGDHERGYRLRAWARLFKDADQTKEET